MCYGLERNRRLLEQKKKKGELDSESDEEEIEKYRCPECNANGKKVVELLENFNKQICICNSENFKGKFYCFLCKKSFEIKNEMDSGLLLEHFMNKCENPIKNEENKNKSCLIF